MKFPELPEMTAKNKMIVAAVVCLVLVIALSSCGKNTPIEETVAPPTITD